jgi:hypothetical protein
LLIGVPQRIALGISARSWTHLDRTAISAPQRNCVNQDAREDEPDRLRQHRRRRSTRISPRRYLGQGRHRAGIEVVARIDRGR